MIEIYYLKREEQLFCFVPSAMFQFNRHQKGLFSEELAALLYRQIGWSIPLKRKKFQQGEIDLLCSRGEEWKIVEVKYRTGNLEESPFTAAQKKRSLLAMQRLEKKGYSSCSSFELLWIHPLVEWKNSLVEESLQLIAGFKRSFRHELIYPAEQYRILEVHRYDCFTEEEIFWEDLPVFGTVYLKNNFNQSGSF